MKPKEILKMVGTKLWTWVQDGGVFIAFVVGLLSMLAFVRTCVDERASDDRFLRKVAAHVRPALVFDEHFRISADQGGSEYVETIEISLSPSGNPTQMVVHAKCHIAHKPYLQSLTANEYMIRAERGRGHDWIITLTPLGTVCDEKLYRIEIIR